MNEDDKIAQKIPLLWSAVDALNNLNDFDDGKDIVDSINDLRARSIALESGAPIPQLSAADVQALNGATTALQTAINDSKAASDIVALATALINH